MKARVILARAAILCAVTALGACANSTSNNSAKITPVPAPVQNVALTLPELAPASTALGRVTSALDVNVRKINTTPRPTTGLLAQADIQPRIALINRRLQCVPFARERSGVAIRGNANTWWKQAAGEFVRIKTPAVGSVMVMQTRRGHVAVVTKIVDKRTVIIDHANWFSNGQIYLDQPVTDVSANNDWSKVVVWHGPLGKFGKRALGVSGFIVDAKARGNSTVYASLADVPASIASGVQYAEAVVTAPKAAPAKVEAPVLVAAAKATPAAITLAAVTAPEAVAVKTPAAFAAAKPIFVNTIVPGSKPAALVAPTAIALANSTPAEIAAATPQSMGLVVVPNAKPSALSAPVEVASADVAPAVVASAKPVLVDMIVPGAKPAILGASAVAVIGKKDAPAASATDTAFIPTGKPTSLSAFR
jgi:surface antigen